MQYLPIFLRLENRRCLVVGGGPVALRKIQTLLRAKAAVTVVALDCCENVSALAAEGRIVLRREAFTPAHLNGSRLVVAATGDRGINRQVSAAADACGIPVNVVDTPDLCSFVFPAIIDRDPLLVAVSSGGAAPVLARLLRSRLETLIPAGYGRLAALAERFRPAVKAAIVDPDQRRAFWERNLQGPVAELAMAGQMEPAAAMLDEALRQPRSTSGAVYLVGAGPGDPDLLTFRALRLMQQADAVVYDRLVSPEVLALCRKDASMIYAGKSRKVHTLPQQQINRLLVELAQQGKQVVRLKGGDPFIFGRGGEEIDTLMEHGIPFQVVPGITAASGCAAYAGIPLTHRDHAQSCVFVAGHRKGDRIELDWDQLVAPFQTVVIYMGLLGLETICSQLVAHGCPPERPAALIQQGTTPRQRVWTATVATLAEAVRGADVQPPTLIIIGEVVRLRRRLAWFRGSQEEGPDQSQAAPRTPPESP